MWSVYSFCDPIPEEDDMPIYRHSGRYLDRRPDRHLNVAFPRGCLEPWTNVGYVTSVDATDAHDKSMQLYSRRAQFVSGRYDYQVTDVNRVPLSVVRDSVWLEANAAVTVPGRTYGYVVTLYPPYQ